MTTSLVTLKVVVLALVFGSFFQSIVLAPACDRVKAIRSILDIDSHYAGILVSYDRISVNFLWSGTSVEEEEDGKMGRRSEETFTTIESNALQGGNHPGNRQGVRRYFDIAAGFALGYPTCDLCLSIVLTTYILT